MSCGIYKITSPSGRIYIGRSVNIERRFKHYMKLHTEGQPVIGNSLRKYTPQAHIFEIIHELPLDALNDEINKWEVFYIKKYKDEGFDLMNRTDGGDGNRGMVYSAETRKKISDAHKERYKRDPSGWQGRKMSNEQKEKLRKFHTGRKQTAETIEKRVSKLRNKPAWNSGKKMPIGWGDIGRKVWTGRKHTEETKLKMSNSASQKPIMQFTRDGEFVREWHSSTLAGEKLKIQHSDISSTCNGNLKTAGNFIWRFKYDLHDYRAGMNLPIIKSQLQLSI